MATGPSITVQTVWFREYLGAILPPAAVGPTCLVLQSSSTNVAICADALLRLATTAWPTNVTRPKRIATAKSI